ncbi:hypothetical protein [Microbacterium sp. CFBP9034]|uniref:hypothetical protein n=1 Tax=Microbacterium sp. CFBP9034 TaxID=3096540 RepID=UPI002A6B55DF|nr:hypothetical protein [Microbacterium sp. CFBP9034]MDY0908697.1 hypothetical protein [Microbacterium sp. CFBP9034]
MLSLVTAAEQQYRHETWSLDRDLALVASIRERLAAQAAAPPLRAVAPPVRDAGELRTKRTSWARPIGARLVTSDSCPGTICAV